MHEHDDQSLPVDHPSRPLLEAIERRLQRKWDDGFRAGYMAAHKRVVPLVAAIAALCGVVGSLCTLLALRLL